VPRPYKGSPRGNYPESFFESRSDDCTTSTYNDGNANVSSFEMIYEIDDCLYAIRVPSNRTHVLN
jgi:hypothetical protein